MSYRIYLQTQDGSKFERTETGSRSIGEAVFKAFLEHDELDGKPVSLHLVHMRTTLAVHRFDAAAGADKWQAGKMRFLGRKALARSGARPNWKAECARMFIWMRPALPRLESWGRGISALDSGSR